MISPDPPADSLTSEEWKELCKQTALSATESIQPFRTGEEETCQAEWGKDLYLALPLWDQGVNSSFHSKRESSLFGHRFSSLPLALAQEKQEKGRLILNYAEAAANPQRTMLSVAGFVLFLGLPAGEAACARQGWLSLLFASLWVSSQAKACLRPCLLSGPVPECFPKDVN